MRLPFAAIRPNPCFIYGNVVFGRDLRDAWAVYRLSPQSYSGLSTARKVEVMAQLEGFVKRSKADFQILRIARPWSIEEYLASTWRTFDRSHGSEAEIEGRREGFQALLETHVRAMEDRMIARPDVYLLVRLQDAEAGVAEYLGSGSLGVLARRFVAGAGLNDPRGLRYSKLIEVERTERRIQELVLDFLDCQRALASEIAWLVRHAYVRGLGEPVHDANFQPQALAIADEQGEEIGFEPFEWDLMRLHADYRVRIGARHLEIESEQGTSYQALLVCGALPEEREFPGPEAELMFAPVDVEFPVDASLSCSYVPNRDAQRLARKRMVDADQIWKEEASGEHGASVDSEERPAEARELQRRLSADDHPPLLRSTISYAVSATVGTEELEERIERLRSEVGARIQLHRPLGAQHQIFLSTLPAQRFPLSAYREHLLPEEVAALVPIAANHAGSDIGPYIGYSLTASRQPIRFDLAEAPQRIRTPTILMTGTQGAGKTNHLELLEYQAFLQGSGPIVDIDPRGTPEEPDHRFHLIPEVAAETEQVVLSSDPEYQGLIDPLRIAPPGAEADIAFAFILDLLPAPVPPLWQTEIRAAIDTVCTGDQRGGVLGEVLVVLEKGNDSAREAGRALAVHGNAGLAKLAFGLPGAEIPEVGTKRVISFQIKNLTLPKKATPRSEMTGEERLGAALLRLLAVYALRLTTSDRDRHSVLGMDEAWVLFGSAGGGSLLHEVSRFGRFQNMTPILATQKLADAEEIEELLGSIFCFGVETEEAAKHALRLLRLDPEDPNLIQRQMSFRKGRCFFRDFNGQVVPMQVDHADPRLLAELNTTPPDSRSMEPVGDASGVEI